MRYPSISITLALMDTLFSNESICKEFPFVGFAKRTWNNANGVPASGCPNCRGGAVNRDYRQHLLETVKASLIGLPPNRIQRLKDLLNTDKIVLHFAVRGQTVTKEM